MIKYPYSSNSNVTESIKTGTDIFGHRIYHGQSLYEYLIEFLLIFVSPKSKDFNQGKLQFHNSSDESLKYWCEPRMGLKRFVFFEKTNKGRTNKADEAAYKKIVNLVKSQFSDATDDEKDEVIEGIQDLIRGYAVIIKNRNWCAPAILPLCPELIFCEAMPNEKERLTLKFEDCGTKIDTTFNFDRRNFLARGGEVYYLHILQGLEGNETKKHKLESLLRKMLCDECKSISKICNEIQNLWANEIGLSAIEAHKEVSLAYIPEQAYKNICAYSVEELITYLSNKIDPINKIEVLGKGVMLQIMRMMNSAVGNYLNIKPKPWIVDMRAPKSDAIRKISSEAYSDVENAFLAAINKSADINNVDKGKRASELEEAKNDSLDVFRSKGKELQCIFPNKGDFTRFTLSEDLIRFLVLSIVNPKEKMTLNQFLDKLYEHYNIIIGPNQFALSQKEIGKEGDSWTSEFSKNLESFQTFLKETGFLRELSDATSIVENPYMEVEE